MSAFTKYVVKATKEGLVDFDGKYLIVTDKGEIEYNEIISKCMEIYNGSVSENDKLENIVHDFNNVMKTNFDTKGMFKECLKLLLRGTDVDVLAFLLAEKDANYKYIGGVMSEHKTTNKRGIFSVIKGNKFDA